MTRLSTQNLSVGYNKKVLIGGIDISIAPGEVVSLIGPNGAGKSTVLKSITRQLEKLGGEIYVDGENAAALSYKSFATRFSVVLTERLKTERMTCEEVVEAGRYPYTGFFGRLTEEDRRIVRESLSMVGGERLAELPFDAVSDGQRQRILLARAICQQPQIMVLDEPTSFLDIRYKIELLSILRRLAAERGMSVLLSLHEIDLAAKISDKIVCVDGDKISAVGAPEEIFQGDTIRSLYGIARGDYNLLFGSVELEKPQGAPRVFVLAGGGSGIPAYRALQRKNIPFSTGILCENDVDFQVARSLAAEIVSVPAFAVLTEQDAARGAEAMLRAGALLAVCERFGEANGAAKSLIALAKEKNIPVYTDVAQVPAAQSAQTSEFPAGEGSEAMAQKERAAEGAAGAAGEAKHER